MSNRASHLATASLALATRYQAVRDVSESLCRPLIVEDYSLQVVPETSPAKWHLAHTTWFFETFILKAHCADYSVFHPSFEYLFNSYYNAVGKQFPRHQRGLLSRPSVEQIYAYRRHVDEHLLRHLECLVHAQGMDQSSCDKLLSLVELGCHHEQQHQELLLMDLKFNWFHNPLYPVYAEGELPRINATAPLRFLTIDEGLYQVGADDTAPFSFDNELPRHQVYLHAYAMADRLISNGEYLEFMQDGGYQDSRLWLADGWDLLSQPGGHKAPLYWRLIDGQWHEYTLRGLLPLMLDSPVSHINAFEADAYARWAQCRLPTEFEWEVFSAKYSPPVETADADRQAFLEAKCYHPVAIAKPQAEAIANLQGQLWQWTSSDYKPYPGFTTAEGAVGEYNGKFMVNQLVLRGGCCVTSESHYRHSYRNFFYAKDRWQFSGIVLARTER